MANAADSIVDSLISALRPGLDVAGLSALFATAMADLLPIVPIDAAILLRCEENPEWVRAVGEFSNGAAIAPVDTLRKARGTGLHAVS